MSNHIDRRKWLRTTAMFTTGLVAAPGLVSANHTQNQYYKKVGFWELELSKRPDLDSLKARLLANENPFGPSEKTRLAIMEAVTQGNRYGHSQAAELRKMLAEKEGVSEEHILLGPGSTDLLEKTAISHFVKGGNIVAADPAYMSLINTAMRFDAEWRKVPLTKDWEHDLEGMEAAVNKKTKLVYICNPNNPTGSITNNSKLRAFCASVSDKAPVFVDEAYLEFLDDCESQSMVDLVRSGKNVIVARTFSKIHAMAGLRIGYMVALPETIELITSMVRSNMGLCVTSIMGAMASLKDKQFQANSKKWTADARSFVNEQLSSMGFDYIPSHTSFILFPIAMEGKPFLEKMFAQGIGVRAFQVWGQSYCRVSMGTLDEMGMFSDALKKVLV
jgi:histidinol-phosphate aminotransferase